MRQAAPGHSVIGALPGHGDDTAGRPGGSSMYAACGGCCAPHAGTAAVRAVWRSAWSPTIPRIHIQMDQGGGSVRDPGKRWRIRPGFLPAYTGRTHPGDLDYV